MNGGRREQRDPRFGQGSEPPTDFEVELIMEQDGIDDVWLEVGKDIGADALFRLLGRIGGEIVSVPTRQSFVRRLYIPRRDQEIVADLQRRVPVHRLAVKHHLSPDSILKARRRVLRTRGRRR